jgi:hypothetical protein
MTDRDKSGRFVKKQEPPVSQPKYPHTEGIYSAIQYKDKQKQKSSNLFLTGTVIVALFLALALGLFLGMESTKNPNISNNATMKQYNQALILNTQKELIGQIIDYEIMYGSGSVRWNVGVDF